MIHLPLLVAKIYSATLMIVGLSLVISPNFWAQFAIHVVRQRHGPIGISLTALPFALLIVLTHTVWAMTPTVIITICGWLMLFKHTLYLLWPRLPSLLLPSTEPKLERLYKRVGLAATVLGIYLCYYTYVDVSSKYYTFL